MFLHLFHWFDQSRIAVIIRDSTWAFAAIEVLHLFGLTLLLGTLIVINVRVFGWGLIRQSISEVAADVMPWTVLGLAVTIISGSLLFVSEAMKCYDSAPFFIKMGCLAAALLLTFTVNLRLTYTNRPSAGSKIAAGLSLALWFSVGLAGRAIAFF